MSSNKVCTFCINKGIPGPHNHTVRNWKIEGKPIICPELLANICSCCNTTGHTRQYCPLRQISTSHTLTNNSLKRSTDNALAIPKWSASKFQKIA